MAPPAWLFALVILSLMTLGVLVAGKSFQESLDSRSRAQRQAERNAAAQQADADILKGVTSALDPLGVFF